MITTSSGRSKHNHSACEPGRFAVIHDSSSNLEVNTSNASGVTIRLALAQLAASGCCRWMRIGRSVGGA